MRPAILLFILLLSSVTAQAQSLQQRLTQANSEPEQVSNQLLSLPATTLSTEDYLVLAEAQLRLRNKEVAMDAAGKALDSAAQPYVKAYAYLLKAQIYGILYRDTAIAITQLEQAEHLLQPSEDRLSLELYSDVLQSFAQAYNQLGNIPRALPYAQRSLALAIKQQNAEAELKARITLGRLTLQNNAYGEAYQHLNQALLLASRLQDHEALASIHLRLGMAYRKIEDHNQALEHLLQAKQRFQQLQRQASYTYTLIYIGETYLEDAATATQAEQHLTEALQLARQQEDLLRVGIATLGLGRLAVLQQQPELALQHFNAAQQLFRQQNVQTYLQETELALAELHLQRGDQTPASHLLQQLRDQIPQAAVYLQLRFHELAARLFAQQQLWPQAYDSLQQASALRLNQLSEQNTFQLGIINQGLQQAATANQWQTELAALQQQLQQQQTQTKLALAALLIVLLALPLSLMWQRRRYRAQSPLPLLHSSHWQHFCQRLQQSNHQHLSLLAFTPTQSQALKLRFGEQQIQLLLQKFLQQLDSSALHSSCVDQDVLWLAVYADAGDVNKLQQELARRLRRQLPAALSEQHLLSLQLPLAQLLDKPWQSHELTALREALWLSWALCQSQPAVDKLWLATLHSTQSRACEWGSAAVRQDLLNAIRLGSMQLQCNNQTLAATSADNLL